MLQTTEQAAVRGDIIIRVVEVATGRLVRRVEIRNLIVTLGLESIGLLLKGVVNPDDVRRLAELRVGEGTTDPATGNTGVETNPGGSPVICPVTTTVTVASNQVEVKCLATLESGQANTYTISEAGLFTQNALDTSAVLFARQVFPGISKTESLELHFDWRITFTA